MLPLDWEGHLSQVPLLLVSLAMVSLGFGVILIGDSPGREVP